MPLSQHPVANLPVLFLPDLWPTDPVICHCPLVYIYILWPQVNSPSMQIKHQSAQGLWLFFKHDHEWVSKKSHQLVTLWAGFHIISWLIRKTSLGIWLLLEIFGHGSPKGHRYELEKGEELSERIRGLGYFLMHVPGVLCLCSWLVFNSLLLF